MDKLTLGERLLWARDAAGLSLAALAEACGLSLTRVRQLEADDGSPTLGTVARVAEALHVAPAWLAWGVGEEPSALAIRAAAGRAA